MSTKCPLIRLEKAPLVKAIDLASNLDLFPNSRGVYAIAGKAVIPLLAAQGYYDMADACHGFIGMNPVVYVGSARFSTVRKRAADHLFGDARKSTFRQSLGLLLAQELGLSPIAAPGQTGFHFGRGEAALSSWIRTNLTLTFLASNDPISLEGQLMAANRPPLNIKGRERDPFARFLSGKRQEVARSFKLPAHLTAIG